MQLQAHADGLVASPEGWAVRVLSPELIEYCDGRAACLVNVGMPGAGRTRRIYASESCSELFPHLRENLEQAAALLKGAYVVV
jgi:hypothetical protein